MKKYEDICSIFGNGDFLKGAEILERLAMRLIEARKKHLLYAEGKYQALGVIHSEYCEFAHAVEHENIVRCEDECLDVLATCVRFMGMEYAPL